MPSLRDIEKTVGTIWIDRTARQWLLSGSLKKKAPKIAEGLNPEVLKEIDRKGADLYGRLINFGHYDLLCSIYPYCQKVLGKDWDYIAEKYFKAYPSDHYNLNKICRHFPVFISECSDEMEKYPYLAELADYEWLELEKVEDGSKIERAESVAIDSLEKISIYSPVVNQTLTLRRYEYPILEMTSHFEEAKRIRKKFAKDSCNVVIYRDPSTHRVRFIELGKVAAAVVEKAQKDQSSYQDLLRLAIELNPNKNPQDLVVQLLELIEELQTDTVFVGSSKKGETNAIE
ncbi:MAG: putative DNA-binding domain-containing protein [Candidatus Obscuribacterales bacterium]|nr:putative DNA-binding domain-containing protein [Candidatus Obscuribacterales bacterium]